MWLGRAAPWGLDSGRRRERPLQACVAAAHCGCGDRAGWLLRSGQLLHVAELRCYSSLESWACRRTAPPGFRAAPRAAFAVTAIRLQSLTPSRLRRCALRLPSGESPAGYPRRTWLGAPRCRRPGHAGSARPAPHRDGQGAGEHAGACCGRLCGCVPSSTLAAPAHHVTKDGSRTTRPALLWSFHATPQDQRRKVRQGRSRVSSDG